MNTQNLKVPDQLKELPIMQFIGDQVPSQLKTPEAKKTLSKIVFWGGAAALLVWFIRSLPELLVVMDNAVAFGGKLILFGIVGVVAITLYGLAPKIISLLHRIGTLEIFKAEKRLIEKNPIESLELLQKDVDSTYKEVDNKINEAEGIRDNFVSDAADLEDLAQKKYKNIQGIYVNMQKLEQDSIKLKADGFGQKSREKQREAAECEQTASLLKVEADADADTAKMYVQYANEFGKAIEILKDNRLAAKMYLNATKTTIKIISRKLDATSRMKEASKGIAEAFNIKDSWVFQVALQSAQAAISQNVATIRNNIQFLNQNSALINGSKAANRAELDDFINKMNNGSIKKLNVVEMADPSYELSDAEKVDKGFKILS